MVHW